MLRLLWNSSSLKQICWFFLHMSMFQFCCKISILSSSSIQANHDYIPQWNGSSCKPLPKICATRLYITQHPSSSSLFLLPMPWFHTSKNTRQWWMQTISHFFLSFTTWIKNTQSWKKIEMKFSCAELIRNYCNFSSSLWGQ